MMKANSSGVCAVPSASRHALGRTHRASTVQRLLGRGRTPRNALFRLRCYFPRPRGRKNQETNGRVDSRSNRLGRTAFRCSTRPSGSSLRSFGETQPRRTRPHRLLMRPLGATKSQASLRETRTVAPRLRETRARSCAHRARIAESKNTSQGLCLRNPVGSAVRTKMTAEKTRSKMGPSRS